VQNDQDTLAYKMKEVWNSSIMTDDHSKNAKELIRGKNDPMQRLPYVLYHSHQDELKNIQNAGSNTQDPSVNSFKAQILNCLDSTAFATCNTQNQMLSNIEEKDEMPEDELESGEIPRTQSKPEDKLDSIEIRNDTQSKEEDELESGEIILTQLKQEDELESGEIILTQLKQENEILRTQSKPEDELESGEICNDAQSKEENGVESSGIFINQSNDEMEPDEIRNDTQSKPEDTVISEMPEAEIGGANQLLLQPISKGTDLDVQMESF
jgi:hypothetical protein